MPITVSYDVADLTPANRNYIRSMLERFYWKRLGGSVFRYEGILQDDATRYEDWLNHVAPSLMFLRSYLLQHNITLRFFTVDAASTSFLDHSDPSALLGPNPQRGDCINLAEPTNSQSSVSTIKNFIDTGIQATQARTTETTEDS
jgi:hypothetical protein